MRSNLGLDNIELGKMVLRVQNVVLEVIWLL